MMWISTLALSAITHMAGPADPAPCLAEVHKTYESGDYSAAAEEASRCWSETGSHDALYTAGVSYRQIGQCASALVLTQRLLKLEGIPTGGRERIEFLAKQCRKESVAVRVQFSPSTTDLEGVLRAELLGSENGELLIILALNAGEPGDRTVYLDPGEWRLRLERDDNVETQTVEVTVATEVSFPDPTPRPDEIVPEPEPEPEPGAMIDDEPRLTLETTLGVGVVGASAALVISGATLVSVGLRESSDGRALPADAVASKKLLYGAAFTSQGVAAFGASLGGGAVAITNFVGADERALIAETATGGALALGGLAWSLFVTQSYGTTTPEGLVKHFDDLYAQDLAAHALLGVGAGMAISAAASLLVTKLRQRRGRARTRQVAHRGTR